MKNAMRITASALGLYAGLLGIEHGSFEVFQGNVAPNSLMINAVGPPCQPDAVWHACFPAVTFIPNFLATGIAAIIMGLSVSIWATGFVHRKHGGLILILLSILMVPVGGGFVPMFIGVLAGVAGTRIDRPPKRRWEKTGKLSCLLAKLWPWALSLLVIWFPGSWILGRFFGQAMLDLGIFLFLLFDVGLPFFIVIASFAHNMHYPNQNQ
jgi:hypothetical protein